MSISVIMPCYNAVAYLEEAIASVFEQGDCVTELIVIDDASTDQSVSLVEQIEHPKIKLLKRSHNGGIALTRNQGIEASSGEVLAFLDADDIWSAECLALMHQRLTQHQWCFGKIQHFYSPELVPKPTKPLPSVQTGYFASSMLVRKTFFRQVGLFNPQLRVGEFIDWFDRARAIDPNPALIDDIVLKRRIHRSNTSLTSHKNVNDYLKVVALAIQRKRVR